MSKTRLNRRLEDMFADVPREETTSRPRRRPPRITGLLTPEGAINGARPTPPQAKSLAYESASMLDRRVGNRHAVGRHLTGFPAGSQHLGDPARGR